MSNEWDDLVKEVSPHEVKDEKRAKTVEENRYEEKEIPMRSIEFAFEEPWRYERSKIYKMLGWKKVKIDTNYSSYGTGKQEIVRTSENTYEFREKKGHTVEQVYRMRLDKSKICDQERYDALTKEIFAFLEQARKKFGEKVSPALLSNKEWFRYAFLSSWTEWLLIGVMILPIPFWIVSRLFKVYQHKKEYAAYQSLAEAYHKKMREFEDEIKRITQF